MLLINAVYFKGEWIIQFDEAATRKQDFFLPEESAVQVDMMTTSGTFSYYSGENCRVARLPYGRDKIAMYIFLPNEEVPLDSFLANLNRTTHNEYISKLQPTSNLSINPPKFKVEYGVKRLNNVLEKLGMKISFKPSEANFSGIASTAPENLYISYVDHKAVVEVDEQGTEAAAVTSVGVGITSLSPSFVRFVVIDHSSLKSGTTAQARFYLWGKSSGPREHRSGQSTRHINEVSNASPCACTSSS
jgi:serpin B